MWFTRVSINNPVFATMVMAALCVLGLFSYSQLRVERLPDITPPIVFVSVAYPGASPDATESVEPAPDVAPETAWPDPGPEARLEPAPGALRVQDGHGAGQLVVRFVMIGDDQVHAEFCGAPGGVGRSDVRTRAR